jgi:3'-phosphoadenosine 5'-phosphosulfate (PAPS) 3'-phosphatase
MEISYFYLQHCLSNHLITITSADLVQVLDPIDGTRGFVKGSEALYVVCYASFNIFNI